MKAAFSALVLVWAVLAGAEGPLHATLEGKVVTGYQGWFRAEGDASGLGWVHYGPGKRLAPDQCSFDLWPDLSELTPEERYPSPFTFADGRTADLFSSVHPVTVRRHFRWMKDYGLDGAMLQRFAVGLGRGRGAASLDTVLRHCTAAANAEGRSLTVMYDLSGLTPDKFPTVAADWRRLVAAGQTKEPCAQHHQGKPLVALWGLGFNDRAPMLDEWSCLITFFHDDGCAVMLGVPYYWRTLDHDCIQDPKLHELIARADIVSPWAVGRLGTPQDATNRIEKILKPDVAWCVERKIDYLPVIFPGFSWQNLSKSRGQEAKWDAIPRLGGRFLWSQALAAKQAGSQMLYIAMFDELDEGTAIFKTTNQPPVGGSRFLSEPDLPSDHFLWLSGMLGKLLRGEASDEMPQR